MRLFCLFTVFTALLLFSSGCCAQNPITNYACENSTSQNAVDWAEYADICGRGVVISNPSGLKTSFFNLTFQSPFFGFSSVSWFASLYGFLSPVEYSMCQGFCEDSLFSTLYGFYNFEDADSQSFSSIGIGTGGDWPMIGLFVYPLTTVDSSKLCYVIDTDSDGSETLQVEYNSFSSEYQADQFLTAQMVVQSDGTIIFRYKSVPNWAAVTEKSIPPSVGLIYSEHMRVVLDTPTGSNDIIGYRCVPNLTDLCYSSTNETDCSDSDGCAWCSANNKCAPLDSQADLCPSTSYISPPASSLQGMYTVDISEQFSGMIDLPDDEFTPLNSQGKLVPLQLPFQLHFFDAEPTNQLFLIEPNIISVSSSTQNCRPLWNTCPNGNYSLAILPFQTAMLWNSETIIRSATINSKSAFVLQVLRVKPYSFQGAPSSRVSYQVTIFQDGSIEFVYGNDHHGTTGTPLLAYPAPLVGLVRNTTSDKYSVLVPEGLIATGTKITFSPVKNMSCENGCGENGYCDDSSKKCVCSENFTGDMCNECKTQFYGPDCQSCACDSGCDDGISGSGICKSTTCGSCNLNNGKCEGNVCVCNSGWSGPSCTTIVDECLQVSLDGCPYCAFNPKCRFCFDNTCFNPLVSNTKAGYTCSYSVNGSEKFMCNFLVQDAVIPFDTGIVILICIIFIILLLIICVLFALNYLYTKRQVPDVHASFAIGGSTDFVRPRRERCVIPINIVQRHSVAEGEYVMGLPLQQVPLKTLYERRYEAEKNS